MPLTASPKKAAVPKMNFDDGFFQYCNTYTRTPDTDAYKGGFEWTAGNSNVKTDIQPAAAMSSQLAIMLQGQNIEADSVAFFLSTISTIIVGDSVGIASDGGTTEDQFFTVVGVFDWDSHVEVALESGRLTDSTGQAEG